MLIIILQKTLGGLIRVIEFLMVARAILSWFPVDFKSTMGQINGFLISITEPIIMPVRKMLFRFPALSSFPVDISFLVTFLLLEAIQMIIYMI